MATTKIHRTFGTPTDLNKWTYSAWIKLGPVSTLGYLFECTTGASNFTAIKVDSTARLFFGNYNSGYLGQRDLSRLLKDPSAWYHIVAVWDSDNATPADRMKLYINGVQQTIYHGTTNPTSGEACQMASGADCWIGVHQSTNDYFSGEMSWVQFVDGSALAPTEFGEVDSTSGIWKIKTDVYGTPGNNGFCLKMEDRTNLDLDSSSNAHTFTTTGDLTATYDNPSNNFATWNPLYNSNTQTFSNGNTTLSGSGSANYASRSASTLCMFSGKWYAEFKVLYGATNMAVGVGNVVTDGTNAGADSNPTTDANAVSLASGSLYNNGVETSSYYTAADGDIYGIAVDKDNDKVYFSQNGTWLNSSDPAAGTNPASTGLTYDATFLGRSLAGSWKANFGNGYFGTTAVSTGNADAAGNGTFEYAVPTGYYTLCTKNLGDQS